MICSCTTSAPPDNGGNGGGGTTPDDGACCQTDGTCVDVVETACTGTFQGEGTDCATATCEAPAADGACCQADGSCAAVAESACTGTFQGEGTDCDTAACVEAEGACCSVTNVCSITTRTDCSDAFLGGGTDCDTATCGVSPFTEEAVARGVEYLVIFGQGDEAGAGVAFLDVDEDGDDDLMTLGLAGTGNIGLFENDGTGVFTTRTDSTDAVSAQQARGIAAGDYDDDGDLDIYLSYWDEANVLLRNDGDFTFTDVTTTAGVGDDGPGGGSAWGDYDGDGLLDLYTTNWETDAPTANKLYRNIGNGQFEDVSAAQGVDTVERSFQPAFVDYDGDADLDLYVANDIRGSDCGPSHNRLYRNDNGVFTDVSVASGANVCLNSMSIALGDVDNNLTLDMHFTNLAPGNVLILNQGDGTFTDASAEAGIDVSGSIGWGSVFFDYDNDGYEELFVCNNNTPNRLYENDGTLPLTDVAASLDLDDAGATYCVAVGDIDNDGDLDMVVQNRQATIRLYINQEGHKRKWVKFRIIGEGANRMGIGTMVTISAGGKSQIRQLLAGNNYKSQNSRVVHFGLGGTNMVDNITVVWPGGTTRTLSNYSANETWTLYPPSQLGSTDAALIADCQGTVRPGCEALDTDGDGDVDGDD